MADVKMKLKKGDKVRIIAGKDKDKEGKILSVNRDKNRIIVEGINMISKHVKPNKNKQKAQGGIIHREGLIDASNVMYLHNGQPTRIGFKVVVENKGGVEKAIKYRVAKKTGEVID